MATLLGHENEVTGLCECLGYVWSCDSSGTILAWNPYDLKFVTKIQTTAGTYINTLSTVSKCDVYFMVM